MIFAGRDGLRGPSGQGGVAALRWDIHIHSKYSPDCRTKVEDILKAARKAGLDGIAVTDHESVKGYLEARKLVRKYGLQIVAGYEYKTREGDILIFGTDEMLKPLLHVREAVELAHEKGAVVVAPHPFDMFRLGIGKHVGKVKVEGIEVVNSHTLFGNAKAELTANRYGLAKVGGSDAHIPREIGHGYTIFWGDLISAIKSRTTDAAGGFHFRTLPMALGSGLLTVPSRIRARWKRWLMVRRTRD